MVGMGKLSLPLDEAVEVFGSYMKDLVLAQVDAIKALNGFPPPALIAFDESTKAECINRFWYHFALERLAAAKKSTFRPGEDEGQRYIAFDERALIRHKHFNNSLRTRNLSTQHSDRWITEGMVFDTLPNIGRCHFGYRMDSTWTVMKDAFVTLPDRNYNLWVWQVWGPKFDDIGVMRRFGGQEPFFRYDDFSQAV